MRQSVCMCACVCVGACARIRDIYRETVKLNNKQILLALKRALDRLKYSALDPDLLQIVFFFFVKPLHENIPFSFLFTYSKRSACREKQQKTDERQSCYLQHPCLIKPRCP